MSRSDAGRGGLIDALAECCADARGDGRAEWGEHERGVPEGTEVELTDDLWASVVVGRNDFRRVTLHPTDAPGFTNVHAANGGVVGPARWVVQHGTLGIRVDLPPDAPDQLVRHCLSHALELAGRLARPLPPSRRRARLERGRRRLERSFEQVEVDPDRLRRLHGGLVVGHRSWTDLQHPEGICEVPVDHPDGSLTYCVLHLVEDRRGVVWLRASAVVGSATPAQVVELGASPSPVMTRQVFVDDGSDRRDDTGLRPVVAVADLDLSDVDPRALSWLVWSVATFAGIWREDEWRCDALPLIPFTALERSASRGPLEVVTDWDPTPVVLVPDPLEASWELPDRSDLDDPSELRDLAGLRERFDALDSLDAPGRPAPAGRGSAHDATCRFHTPRPAGADGACGACAHSVREGGRTLLETLHQRGVLTDAEHRELDTWMDGMADPLRQRQAETRLAVKVAQRAPIRDLGALDVDESKARLAQHVGTHNPSYRAGCEIVDVLVGDGSNEPILLVGPAGLGKTHVAKLIASAVLDLPVHLVSLGAAAGRHTICGSDLAFRNADRGAVVGGIVAFDTLQFVLVLDELEKLAGHASDDYPLAALLAMLDDQRASFTDSFVGAEPGWQLDLTSTVFVATANEQESLPEPVVSRMRVIDMPAWTAEEKLHLAQREAARIEEELALDRPIPTEVLEFIVGGCPESGIRELLRALRRYRGTLTRSRDSLSSVDPLAVFPPAAPTPVAARATVPSTPGVTRSVALTPRGWQELRCTATPNGSRWAGSLDALGADGDTFLLHWVPMLEAALGVAFPPCTLHLDPPLHGPHVPAGLPLAALAAVTSAVTGLTPEPRVLAPLRADPQGRLSDLELTAADVAGLAALDVGTVALAAPRDDRGLEWTRADLPAVTVAPGLVELVALLVPGLDRWEQPRDERSWGGYL